MKRAAIVAIAALLSVSPARAADTQWSLVLAMGQNTFIVGGYSTEDKCEEARSLTGKSLKKAKVGRAFCIVIRNSS